MARGVAEDGVRPGEQHPGAVLLALAGRYVGKWPGRSEGLVRQVDADDVIAEPSELAYADLDCLHGREHALLRLIDQELRACLGLDQRVQAGGSQERPADRYAPDRLPDDQRGGRLADPP